MGIRIPKEGTVRDSYYVIQSCYTHETKWGDPYGKMYKRNPNPTDWFYEWGEMSATYDLGTKIGIDMHKAFQTHGPSRALMTLKDARKLLAACLKEDKKKDSIFDRPMGSDRKMQSNRHVFRIAGISYKITTTVIK